MAIENEAGMVSDGEVENAAIQKRQKVWKTQVVTDAREQLGERLYNLVITRVPSHWVRQSWLRLFGVKIGKKTSILMGTRVHGIRSLTIGNHCSIGSRCLLDARGELAIEDAVVLDDDVQVIAGHHVIDSDDFRITGSDIRIGHHAYIASRATILTGVYIGAGAVVGRCSMVYDDVASMAVVEGIPAVHRGIRKSSLDYWPDTRPMFT